MCRIKRDKQLLYFTDAQENRSETILEKHLKYLTPSSYINRRNQYSFYLQAIVQNGGAHIVGDIFGYCQ